MRDDLDKPFVGAPGPIDPIEMARRDLRKPLSKRFWTEVAVVPREGGWGIDLDGKPVRTPAKAFLKVGRRELAELLAAEWRAQEDVVDPDAMPMVRLVNTAIDGVAGHRAETIAEVAKFAETDLVCYRAGDPAALVDAQAAAWDPVLAFARDELGARLVCSQGVMFAAQPETALAAVRKAVEDVTAGSGGVVRLAALSVMTSLTGSVLIAVAVAYGVLDVAAAWTAAHVDEDYQERLWGKDDEAMARRDRRWRDMRAAAEVYAAA